MARRPGGTRPSAGSCFQAALLAALARLRLAHRPQCRRELGRAARVGQLRASSLQRAGFDIPFRLIAWTTADSYGRALWVCFLNTLLAAALGIAAATALGLLLGIMRLSENWLVRNVALGIVEIVRNTPQLLQIVFWYVVVIQSLPAPRAGILLPGGVHPERARPRRARRGLDPERARPARPRRWRSARRRPRLAPAGPLAMVPRREPRRARRVLRHSRSPRSRRSRIPCCAASISRAGSRCRPELIALVAGLSIYCCRLHRRDRARLDRGGCASASAKRLIARADRGLR